MGAFVGAGREVASARPTRRHDVSAPAANWDADDAVTHLYAAYYRSLVRLAALLLRDIAEAEDVVQDAFVAMHDKWGRLRDPRRHWRTCGRWWSTSPGQCCVTAA
jgi:hypothetical protein